MHTHRNGWKTGILFAPLLLLFGCEEPVEPEITINIPIEGSPATPVPTPIDPRLPRFEPSKTPRLGKLQIVAEPATQRLAQLWASILSKGQPSLRVQTRDRRSDVPKAWWNVGPTPSVALLKEEMKPEEQAAFETEWGYPPQRMIVAMDPTVIVVPKGNPLVRRGLSLGELEAIFSLHPRDGNRPIRKWDALGLGEEWASRDISPYGQDSGSPLYRSFRQRVLRQGEYRPDMLQVPNSETVVAEVKKNPDGIGYASLSAFAGKVSAVPIADGKGKRHHFPTADNLVEGRYPLSPGHLFLYINHRPGVALDALQRELVRFIYSQTGQRAATEVGMVPISALYAGNELQRLEISLNPEDVLLASSRGGR